LTFRLRITSRAARQVRTAGEWWHRNRRLAPAAFADDVEAALSFVVQRPYAGEPVRHPRHGDVRRRLLRRIRYHIYYSVSEAHETVTVLAFWHSSRGTRPRL
jgi:plasmid stabilization system protein ParE